MSKRARSTNAALKLAPARAERRLDFGSGQTPKEGFEGVDLYAPNVLHKVDLRRYPLPWGDCTVDEIYCSHFVEHLPAREIEERDGCAPAFLGQDYFFAFFDECYRILKVGATMTVVVPNLRSNRAFQDPTHRRFIPGETWLYLSAEWRKANQLDHYRVKADFNGTINPVVLKEMTLMHDEVQAQRFNHWWNTILDWNVPLVKK
jgi:predicted SAM-dependent methyltransferase